MVLVGQLGLGVLLWLGPAIVTALVLVAVGAVSLTSRQSPVEFLLRFLGLIVLVALFEAIPEELVFRG